MATGNLGAYQLLSTLAKKVGGPKNLAVIVAVGGFAVGRGVEVGAKWTVKQLKSLKGSATLASRGRVFTVVTDTEAGGHLKLRAGDKFRVLDIDAESVLIEVLNDTDNPYFVSAELLMSLSDFAIEADED